MQLVTYQDGEDILPLVNALMSQRMSREYPWTTDTGSFRTRANKLDRHAAQDLIPRSRDLADKLLG